MSRTTWKTAFNETVDDQNKSAVVTQLMREVIADRVNLRKAGAEGQIASLAQFSLAVCVAWRRSSA